MRRKNEPHIIIHVEMVPVQQTLMEKAVNFRSKFNEKRDISFLNFCSELRNKNVIHDYIGYGIGGFKSEINKKENIMNHLYRIKKITATRSFEEDGQPFGQDGLLNLLFHLILGWHRQLEDWKKIESLTVGEVVLGLKNEPQYYESKTTRPVKEADPRDYIVKRSGWIMPGHFGAKSGG
jgi:hypothetical protein